MKRLLISLCLLCAALTSYAQTDTLRGHWVCRQQMLHIYLDLGEESLTVPLYEFLGKVNGYMRGNINNTWFLTTFKPHKDGGWTMRFSNDSGADTQELHLTLLENGHLCYKVIGDNYVRRAKRGKWEYLPEELDFEPLSK